MEIGGLEDVDPNIAANRMDSLSRRGLENMADRAMNISVNTYDSIVSQGYNNIVNRNMDGIDISGREMDNVTSRGMENMVSSTLDNMAARNVENIATGNINNIAVRNMDNYSAQNMESMPGGIESYTSRDMENIVVRNMENIAARNMENIAARNMENIAARNMENIATSSMGSIATTDMDNIATRVMENIAVGEMENIGTREMENIGTSGVNSLNCPSAGSMTAANTMAVDPSSLYEQGLKMTQAEQHEVSEEISESKFAEEVDEIVQNLEEKMDESGDKGVSSSQEQSEDVKSASTVATKFVHIIDDHSENFRHQMHQQWLKGQYCDLVVKVKDREFKVHSCVFAAFSPVLCHLKKNMTLCLPEIEHSAIAPLVKMMYTGILCFDLADAPYVALAAKRLMLSDIYSACEDYISQCQKSGLTASDVNPTMVATGGVQVTIKKYGMEGYSAEYSHDKSTQMSGDEEQISHQPNRRRGRPKRRPRKRYSKRGRPPKIKTDPNQTVVKSEYETTLPKSEIPELMKEEKVVLSQQDEDEDVDVELEDEEENLDEEDEYIPGDEEKKPFESRRRIWPHKKSSAVMKWFLSRRKDKIRPKHTKRDNTGRLKCPGCHASFSSSDELQNHIETSSEHNAFRCTQCGVAYIRKSNLTRHMRTVHSSSYHLKCRFCNISTKTERELRNHCLEMHSNNSPFECEYPGCSYRTYKYDFLRRHKQIHSDQKDYVCDKCGKTFSQQAGLLSHHRTCYHLQEYLCDVCGQAFNHYQSMKSHRRSIHYGERPFMCTDCGTRFSDHRNLKRHRRIHENVFPYACQICGQKYRHSNSLKAHMKKHTDVMSAEAAATSALINSYTPADVEIGAQYSHPHPPPISLPPMPLNHLHDYYASACDKYVPMTSMSSVVPSSLPLSSNPIPTTMNSTVTSVGLDTLADLCLSSSVV